MTAKGAGHGRQAVAIFAGGCFWCMEPPFDKIDGVLDHLRLHRRHQGRPDLPRGVGRRHRPCRGGQDRLRPGQGELRAAARRVLAQRRSARRRRPVLRPRQPVPHRDLLHDQEQRQLAEASKRRSTGRFDSPIVTEIVPAGTFYPAEDYHQNYYKKNPIRYKFYRWNCGRDQRLASSGARRRPTEDLTAASRACRRAAPRRGVVLRYKSGLGTSPEDRSAPVTVAGGIAMPPDKFLPPPTYASERSMPPRSPPLERAVRRPATARRTRKPPRP